MENRKQVVLITGALTGIGRATAFAFADEGANIVVSGRSEEKGAVLVGELRSKGIEAEFVRADVRNEIDVKNLVGSVIARFGRIDVAVNNAATEGIIKPATDLTPEDFRETFDTNVKGVLFSLKHELQAMLGQKSGSIVNISSTLGQQGTPGASLYVASKHAVEGLTKSAALEAAASGVRVNIVAPGPIDTGMLNRFTGTPEVKAGLIANVPMKRIGKPEEIAQVVVLVSSPKNSFMTGATVLADGGKVAAAIE